MTDRAAASLPIPGTARSWWLREALAAEGDPPPLPALRDHVTADVAIIGGGYTGLWTAWFLLEHNPGSHRAAGAGHLRRRAERPERRLPPRLVGGRADARPSLRRRGGGAIGRAADEVVDGIGAWCATHGVDAWYAKRGYLRVNAFPGRPNDWDGTLAELARLGLADALMPLPAAEVQRVCASPAFGDGLLMPSAASVQPARLARGLRRVLLERGVQIAEGTRALRVDGRGPLRVVTAGGSVAADHVVLAINAWAAGWPGFRTGSSPGGRTSC